MQSLQSMAVTKRVLVLCTLVSMLQLVACSDAGSIKETAASSTTSNSDDNVGDDATPPSELTLARCPWMDPTKTAEQRADEFVAAATMIEKLELTASTVSYGGYFLSAAYIAANPRLCFPGLVSADASSGVVNQVGVTAFPTQSSQAAIWDPELMESFGQILGSEHRAKGINVVLGPSLNTVRLPNGGRNFEYAGEDPYLAGVTGVALVRGIHANHLLTQLKHFAVNSQETDRNPDLVPVLATNPTGDKVVDMIVDERVIREAELPAFERVIKEAGSGSVMCSYNKVNGVQACENEFLLKTVLRDNWGFAGFVASDYGAARSSKTINAGMEMENSLIPARFLGVNMLPLLASGEVSTERLDEMVRRIVQPMFKGGLFEHPPSMQPAAYASIVSGPASIAMARRMASEGTVLLKNASKILPLQAQGKKIAVLGSGAINPGLPAPGPLSIFGLGPVVNRPYTGGGSSSVLTTAAVYPCDGMTSAAARYGATVTCNGTSNPETAAALARSSDIAIVFAWLQASEGADLPSLDHSDSPLIDAVSKANPNTVVVLISGNPVLMPWLNNVPAVLQGWIAGQEFGNAYADVLFGDVEPGGRLPVSFLKESKDSWIQSAEQFPGVNFQAKYSEGLFWGYRWFDQQKIEPLFAFGHGLSYTTWDYSELEVTPTTKGAKVSFTVHNTGARAGLDVAQIYVGFPPAAEEPPRQLKGFQKVRLASGGSQRVTVQLDARAFQIWSNAKKDWITVPGSYGIYVGRSSRNLLLSGTISRGG